MKTVVAGVLTLEEGLVVATQLSLPISQIVEAFGVKVLPTKTTLKKMLAKADLQKMWAIYRGFEAILRFNGSGFYRSEHEDEYRWSGFEQEHQTILFSIEELLQRSMDGTEDSKELRELLNWTDKKRHESLRSALIDKLGRSIRQSIPAVDHTTRKWIREEGVINDYRHNGILELLQVEDDKHYEGLLEANTDPWTLLLICESVASSGIKDRAIAKALENANDLSSVRDVALKSRYQRQKRSAWDKVVDLAGDDKEKLWEAVNADYKEERDDDCRPRSKALTKLLTFSPDLDELLRMDRRSIETMSYPYQEMQNALLKIVTSATDSGTVKRVRIHIKEKYKENNPYREVMLASVRRLYELQKSSQSS